MFAEVNYLAVLVSGLIYFLLGGVWYAAIFSKPYQAALNFNVEEKAKADRNFPKALLAHFISGLISSLVLANIIRSMQANGFIDGMVCGFWTWLGFAFTLGLNSFMFERRPAKIFQINNGFYLVAFAVIGGILAVWR